MGATRESPSLDEATEDSAELGELRRRAYGPAADIFDDSGALARLIELERRHGARGWMPLPEARTDPGDEATAAPTAEDDAGERPVGHRPRWRASALVATVAGAALLAGAVLSAVGGSSSEATLYPRTQVPAAAAQELDSAGDLRYLGIDRAGAELYDEFRGLNVWSARRGPQTICLFITSTASRSWGVDCTPWDGTPTITLTRYRDTEALAGGEPFRDAPVGSRISFVLKDGAVQAVVEPATGDPTER